MRRRAGGADAFSATADDYAVTMAPALEPVAAEVVRRAELGPGETVLDVGTGTGTAAGLARGEGRHIIGLDGAPGMLEIARGRLPDVELVEADFLQLPQADASVDVVLAVHALLFADDRVAALREWRRVARRGGRLSLSVPGPGDVVPSTVLGPVYDRYGIRWGGTDYPRPAELSQWATDAGWGVSTVEADPMTGIPLADEAAYRAWLRVGSRLQATSDWSDARREALARDLMAVTPRDAAGWFRLPFGSIYLVARNV
ncbi:MAG: class I SAM-dependent methyltransferase [Candidatus Limnocylindria bacterium]